MASFHRQVRHESSTCRRGAGSDVTMVSSEPNYENHGTRRVSTESHQSPCRERECADVRQLRTSSGTERASTRRHRRHSSDSSTPTGSDSDLRYLTDRRASRRRASLTRSRQRQSDLLFDTEYSRARTRQSTRDRTSSPMTSQRETRHYIKAERYDGSGCVDIYLAKFQSTATYNGWTEYDKAAHLRNSLVGMQHYYCTAVPTRATDS